MKIVSFEDLVAWQKAQDLAVVIYREFKDSKDFSFKDQICRAAVSISNNIAEGFDRNSKKEFVRFLYIAKGSCAEVKSMMFLAYRLNYSLDDSFKSILDLCDEILKIIRGLIKSIIPKII
jgi:four helix bundle protein